MLIDEMTKQIRISPHEILEHKHLNWLALLREKGFPIKGSFILEVDWDKIEAVTRYTDDKTDDVIIEWREKE